MNGLDGLALAAALRGRLAASPAPPCDLLVCPPATLVSRVAAVLRGSAIAVGGQDCHAEPGGPHTGDVSAELLAEAGATQVIVGHSERRASHGETDAMVRAKAEAARRAGLGAIICIGETAAERQAGRARDVVGRQLAGSLPARLDSEQISIAYEPIWAIGSGRTATLDEIADMHVFIRSTVAARGNNAPRVLYGGSVNADNAKAILALAEVGGALVGGASLAAASFWAIAMSCR